VSPDTGLWTTPDGRSFRLLPERPAAPWPSPQVDCLGALTQALAARGIDLIVAPMPTRELINFAALPESDGLPESSLLPFREELILALSEADVEVIDMLPELQAAAQAGQRLFYTGRDRHPADAGIRAAANIVAKRLGRYGRPATAVQGWRIPVAYGVPEVYTGFPSDAYHPRAFIAHQVFGWLVGPGQKSRVLVLGDSFAQVPAPYGVPNASFAHQLSADIGQNVATYTRGGGAPQIMVELGHNLEVLEGPRVAVLFFSEVYLYRGGQDDRPERQWRIHHF
jgi:hypothetical protein